MAKTSDVIRQVSEAAVACEEKKAEDISILELDKAAGGFTDYFVICSGANPRQIQTISDEVERRLQKEGTRPTHVEGYQQAEWVLLDYVDFVVHVFSQRARNFYNLERLWKSAKQLSPQDLRKKTTTRRARGAAPKRAASGSSGTKARRKSSAKKGSAKASASIRHRRPRPGS